MGETLTRNLKSFLGVAEERESGNFVRGVNKYRMFGKVVEFSDAGTLTLWDQ